ncbi:MAG: helix-turn-helix domain-containing protein [Phycisphaerae bacterium]
MAARKKQQATVSNTLRAAIRECGKSLLEIQRDTGVQRASLSRFVRQERHLRSDAVDKLASYFGLALGRAKRR